MSRGEFSTRGQSTNIARRNTGKPVEGISPYWHTRHAPSWRARASFGCEACGQTPVTKLGSSYARSDQGTDLLASPSVKQQNAAEILDPRSPVRPLLLLALLRDKRKHSALSRARPASNGQGAEA